MTYALELRVVNHCEFLEEAQENPAAPCKCSVGTWSYHLRPEGDVVSLVEGNSEALVEEGNFDDLSS